MITSLIEMLELPDFGHITDLQNHLSHNIRLLCINLYFKKLILRRPRVANFVDIIKIATILINNLWRLKKVKRIRNYVIQMQSISVFLDMTKVANFWWKMLMPAEVKMCVIWFIFFGSFLEGLGITVPSFITVGCVTDFKKNAFPPPSPPICQQSWKGPSWIGLMLFRSWVKECILQSENSKV